MLLAVLVPLLMNAPPEPAPLVQLSSGSLRGAFEQTMAVFKGIPYAAPPVRELRWREPQPPAPWAGVRDATRPGSACVQNPKGVASFLSPLAAAYGAQYQSDPVASSEDCLYLNVRVPQWPPQRALPVMVWLHGGQQPGRKRLAIGLRRRVPGGARGDSRYRQLPAGSNGLPQSSGTCRRVAPP
jgi:hypothetical protein